MKRFSCAFIPNFLALTCLEVGEKFTGGGGGMDSFPLQKQSYTNLELSWFVVRFGCIQIN